MLIFFCGLALSFAHSPHSQLENVLCDASRPEAAPITSYHAHVQFLQNNNESVATAKAVHDAFVAKFFTKSGAAFCTSDFNQTQLCIWANDPCLGPIGPFSGAQWAAYVPVENFASVVGWFQQFRQGMSVLVHPNTGCSELDHSTWPMWLGSPWHLDIEQFRSGEPSPKHECPLQKTVPRAYYPCCGQWDRL